MNVEDYGSLHDIVVRYVEDFIPAPRYRTAWDWDGPETCACDKDFLLDATQAVIDKEALLVMDVRIEVANIYGNARWNYLLLQPEDLRGPSPVRAVLPERFPAGVFGGR